VLVSEEAKNTIRMVSVYGTAFGTGNPEVGYCDSKGRPVAGPVY